MITIIAVLILLIVCAIFILGVAIRTFFRFEDITYSIGIRIIYLAVSIVGLFWLWDVVKFWVWLL
jgi:hypothetical protein